MYPVMEAIFKFTISLDDRHSPKLATEQTDKVCPRLAESLSDSKDPSLL